MAGLNDFFLFLFWTHLRWEMHIIRKATATQNEPTSFLGWQFYDFHIYVVWNFFYYISKSIVQIDLLYSLPNNCLEGHLEKKFWKNNLQKYGLERQAVHFSIVTIWLRGTPRGLGCGNPRSPRCSTPRGPRGTNFETKIFKYGWFWGPSEQKRTIPHPLTVQNMRFRR